MVNLSSISTSLVLSTLFAYTVQAGKTCTVQKSDTDDSLTITDAFKQCSSGGTVVFPKGSNYTLDSIVDVSGLKNVKVKFYGTVNLPEYNKKYSNESVYFNIKGSHIKFDGGGVGTFQGDGQQWWDKLDKSSPTVLGITANNSEFKGFKMINAPRYHMEVFSSHKVTLKDIYIHTASINENRPKNTDALDIYNSTDITFRDSTVTVGDDCLSVKDNATNIIAKNLNCTGGHGFSVGSLGKNYAYNYVKGIHVSDSYCSNCQNGVRIKTWPGGNGAVSDIVFENVELVNSENPVIITTHYCDNNQMQYCWPNIDKSLSISGITVKNIRGSVSNDGNPVINVNCSSTSPCSDFTLQNINISRSNNTPANVCDHLEGSDKIAYCSQ
ncbi:pectin lyase fold/virulence factor [Blakeslea trispora]|nr:pectin lyase fold/virulence factor [Blakeslea trispora]